MYAHVLQMIQHIRESASEALVSHLGLSPDEDRRDGLDKAVEYFSSDYAFWNFMPNLETNLVPDAGLSIWSTDCYDTMMAYATTDDEDPNTLNVHIVAINPSEPLCRGMWD